MDVHSCDGAQLMRGTPQIGTCRREKVYRWRWLPALVLSAFVLNSCVDVEFEFDPKSGLHEVEFEFEPKGRWQEVEASETELEFTEADRFTEYRHGEAIGTGSFEGHGREITLVYDNCDPSTGTAACSMILEFHLVNGTFVLAGDGGDILFRPVSADP